MRIGMVIEHFEPARGGAEQWTYQFGSWLLAQGHEVHLVTRAANRQLEESGYRIHEVRSTRSRIQFAIEAEKLLQTIQCDLCHDMGHGWHCDVFQPHGGSRYAAQRQNLRMRGRWQQWLNQTVHPWLPRYREFERLAARQYEADDRLFIALSERVARDFQRFHAVPRSRIRRIYNGVDTVRFSPRHRSRYRDEVRYRYGIEPHETALLIVAHNLKLKGVPTLLEAIAPLRNRHSLRLLIVGSKRQRAMKALATRHGVHDCVTFVGPVHDPVPFYAAADIYVQPTFYDPCSLVVLEALASALPVVTTCQNGVAELMFDGVQGRILAEPGDAGELYEKLLPMFDPRLRRELAQAARELAEQNELVTNFRRIYQVYTEACGSLPEAA